MKKLFITLIVGLFSANFCLSQVKIDTLFYDMDGKGVESEVFASYFRITATSGNASFQKKFKDFFITGELYGEGNYISIDKYDDNLSIFDGKLIRYYKNGKASQIINYTNGVKEGKYASFYKDGTYEVYANFKNDKLDGDYCEFSEDGKTLTEIEFQEGEPIHDYYILSNMDGCKIKVRFSDDQPIYESPSANERKVEYYNGATWLCYNKNGITIAMTNSEIQDYGKYYQTPILVMNNSMFPIDFDPNKIMAYITNKNGEAQVLTVLSADEYMKKIQSSQDLIMGLQTLSSGLASLAAGHSTSTTTSSSSGNSSNYGNVTANISSYDSDGYEENAYAYGNYSNNNTYIRNSTSVTNTYNSDQADKEIADSNKKTASLRREMESERRERNNEYLKRTTLYPGDVISGYVNIKREKGSILTVYIDINGAIYEFPWDIEK